MNHTTNFATQALLASSSQQSKHEVMMNDLPIFEIERRMSNHSTCSPSLKRSRPIHAFDMSEFLEASKQVEDSMAFPTIEWPSFDDSDDSDSEEEGGSYFHPSSSKRQCKGLVRCNRSSNLSTLASVSSDDVAVRRGSNGSLS
jgi:hypothetical protein